MIDEAIVNEYDSNNGGLFGYSLPDYDEHDGSEDDE